MSPILLSIFIDAQMIQAGILQEVEKRKKDSTLVISFDDTIKRSDMLVATQTTYYESSGKKLGSGEKPFTERKQLDSLCASGVSNVLILDVGVWSGKTMTPLIDRLTSRGVEITVITGFIKKRARERFEEKGVKVKSLLPFSDYDDWAETRDLLTLFIKSGFFVGRRSKVDSSRYIPYGKFLGKQLTYFTQPTSNLNLRYEQLGKTDYMVLTREFFLLSQWFWKEMEKVNPELTLGQLRELFPVYFGLPLLTENQVSQVDFSPNDKPSDVISRICDIL